MRESFQGPEADFMSRRHLTRTIIGQTLGRAAVFYREAILDVGDFHEIQRSEVRGRRSDDCCWTTDILKSEIGKAAKQNRKLGKQKVEITNRRSEDGQAKTKVEIGKAESRN